MYVTLIIIYSFHTTYKGPISSGYLGDFGEELPSIDSLRYVVQFFSICPRDSLDELRNCALTSKFTFHL